MRLSHPGQFGTIVDFDGVSPELGQDIFFDFV
jgi:hypothetical protein